MAGSLIFHESWSDARVRFTVDMDAAFQITVRFEGRGSMDGTHAFIALVDRCLAMEGARGRVRGLVDLSQLDGAPLRSQLVLGRWLLGCRDAFDRLAIAGGGRFERGLAKAVTSMARMENVGFFDTASEASGWLGAAG